MEGERKGSIGKGGSIGMGGEKVGGGGEYRDGRGEGGGGGGSIRLGRGEANLTFSKRFQPFSKQCFRHLHPSHFHILSFSHSFPSYSR
jgi:hypothetical protein